MHVYLNADQRGDSVEADAQRLLAELNTPQDSLDPPSSGDAFMFGYVFDNQSEQQVVRTFGSGFLQSLGTVATGTWQGPIASGYGLHLVFVKMRIAPRLPP